MGTRHLICVQHNNEYKVAKYGQWDGYPSGQGAGILEFLKGSFNKALFIQKLDNILNLQMSKLKLGTEMLAILVMMVMLTMMYLSALQQITLLFHVMLDQTFWGLSKILNHLFQCANILNLLLNRYFANGLM